MKNVVKLVFIPNHIVTVLSSTWSCTPSSWKLIALLNQFLFSRFCICNCQFLVSFMTNIKVTIDMKNTEGKSARFLVFVLILSDFKYSYVKHFIKCTRSLGALWAPTSSWRPFGPLDFFLRALRALRPTFVGCWIVCWPLDSVLADG